MIGLVVGGVASGVGKTTLTLGLIGALRRRGLSVQPFKVGPDYIDPSHHAQAAGHPSRNLDSWMVPEPAVRELFWRATRHADAAIVEGVMGLFDGRTGGGEAGSTAQVAKMLGLPVLLVVDAAKAARSVAATVLGCQALDPALTIIGVVLNNVAGERHAAIGREAIESLTSLPVLGWLPREDALRQQERYLGLVPAAERQLPAALLETATARVEQHIDLERLLRLASLQRREPPPSGIFPSTAPLDRVRIAVAQDAAFNFYYQDSLDLLVAWGAELVSFSPLRDAALPAKVGAVYLGGGFPELFAAELAANRPMLASMRAAASAGLPVYAECGGLMYLQHWLTDADGQRHQLVGVIPGASTLVGRRLTLGYREARARRSTLLTESGAAMRGHEFHWSHSDTPSTDHAAYDLHTDPPRLEGFAVGSVLASYLHVHFASDKTLAPRFVAAARRGQARPISTTLAATAVKRAPSTLASEPATHLAGPVSPPAPRIIPPRGLEGETMVENDAGGPARVLVVGVGEDGPASLIVEVLARVREAELLVGGERHLELFPDVGGRRLALVGDLDTILGQIDEAADAGQHVVVLEFGDPCFHGIGPVLAARLGRERVEIVPGVSSVALAFARLGIASEDARVVSAHGRQLTTAALEAVGAEKLAVLTDETNTPAAVAAALLAAGAHDGPAWVFERLGGPDERISESTLTGLAGRMFASLNVLVVPALTWKRVPDVGGALFGLSELMYAHSNDMISRPEVRAISLSKLRLRPGGVLWDIGAASGALAIEAAGLIPRLTVHAVERSDEQLKHLLRNIGARTTATRVRVKAGEAPDILSELPDPDAIFVGGGGARLTEILTECAARLKPNGRIVCNLHTIESVADVVRWAEARGLPAEVVQVSVARSVDVVGNTRLAGENPVNVVTISP